MLAAGMLTRSLTHDLVKAMVGRELTAMYPEKTARIGDVVLEVDDICKEGYFKNVSFNVRRGEILALTGLVGAGRTEVCQTYLRYYAAGQR